MYNKFKIQPFTIATIKTGVLIIVCGLSLFFWEFNFHPILNIAIKSVIVAVIYGFIVYRFRLSEDISTIITKILKR